MAHKRLTLGLALIGCVKEGDCEHVESSNEHSDRSEGVLGGCEIFDWNKSFPWAEIKWWEGE